MMIRRLQPGEGAVFARIRLESLENEPESFASDISDFTGFYTLDWEPVLAKRTAFVAFQDDVPIGLAALVRMEMSRLAHRAEVINVYVNSAHRGRGIAASLWSALEQHAVAQGIEQLELAVNAENADAIRFYLARGCRQVGTIPRGFRHGDRYFDEVLMIRELDRRANPA